MRKRVILPVLLLLLIPIQVLAQHVEEIDSLIDQGIQYERDNKLQQAIDTYRHVLEFDQKNIMVRIRLAKVLSWTNQYDEALIILNEVLEQNPEQPEALFRKAQILSWQGKYEESILLFKNLSGTGA